jgi:hypothetical protein
MGKSMSAKSMRITPLLMWALPAIQILSCVACYAGVFDVEVKDISLPSQPTIVQTFDTSTGTLASGSESNLVKLFPGYTNKDQISFSANYRGMPVFLTFPAGQTRLDLSIPSCNSFQRSFDGGSRDESNRLIRQFFKQDDGNLNAISRCLVKESDADPMGNTPGGAMYDLPLDDFNVGLGRSDTFNAKAASQSGDGGTQKPWSVGASLGTFKQGNVKSQSIRIPFSREFGLGSKDKELNEQPTFILGGSASITDIEGARVYSLAPRVSLRIPATQAWTVTTTVHYGQTVSRDFGAAGQMVSTSVTSAYTWDLEKFSLTMGNMVGYYRSLPISKYGYRFDPEIRSTAVRNGIFIMWPGTLTLFGRELNAEYFFVDTRYFGTDLFLRSFDEFGFSLGADSDKVETTARLRLGLTFYYSSELRGATINFGYQF